MMFCQDVDLLYWDQLIWGYTNVGQLVISSAGNLSGTVITVTSLSLTDYDVQPGQVALIQGPITAMCPIIDVTANTLTISLLSAGLEPDDGSAGAPVIPSISTGSVTFAIRTFWPYRRVISDQLLAAAGVPAAPVNGVMPTILNPQDFKRACALGSLALAYSGMSASYLGGTTGFSAAYEDRSTMYSTLFSQAVRSIRAELDWNGDGRAEETRYLGEVRLRRE